MRSTKKIRMRTYGIKLPIANLLDRVATNTSLSRASLVNEALELYLPIIEKKHAEARAELKSKSHAETSKE